MAYALRYYKEIAQADGGVVRLEIHKKDSTTAAVEIGAVVQGLSLEIQGQQDDIDSPIQKTSLHMTFVDASDIENGQKNGFWQEFYTPDALMWKVILKAKDATETSFRTIWGGYVTPDSFSEDLVYRGSVSITARDNIGHMQDFPFDAEGGADGMISLYNLVESGWEKIQSPMMLEWRGAAESTMWLMCDGVSAMFTLMNVSMFEGMDWYKAIETALASYGVVMRYVGNNIVKMSSLRSMPYQGEEFIEDLIHIEPTFVSGATRELIPAVKRIEESVDYDLGEEYQPRIDSQDFSGNTFDVETSWGTVENIAWSLLQSVPMSAFGWYNETPFKTLAFNPNAYEVDDMLSDSDKEDLRKYTCVLTGSKDDNTHSLSYAMSVNAEDFAINVTFGKFLSRLTHGYGDYFLGYPANEPPADYSVRFAVSVQTNGITYYLTENGVWSTEFASQKVVVSGDKMSVNVPLSGKYTGRVNVSFTFLNIDTSEEAVRVKQILALSLSSTSNKPMLENNTINTNYQEGNNVILTRDPELAPAMNTTALPAFIKNGIFYRSGNAILPAKKWSWGSGSEQQMAVFNHLQLLSYYAKPNNLISGTIVNADITRAQAIYIWHGAEHILVSGTYNFLNGHIEGAVLREFARYEDMWSEVAGADLPDTEQDSRSNVEGGSASGGSSSTYSNTTTVNIGSGGGGGTGASNLNDLLDVDTTGVVAQSVLYYNGTSWVDMSLNTLLNPYLKADVAANTYALKSVYEAFVASLGSLAYKNGLTASDIPDLSGIYLPKTGGTINTTSAYGLAIDSSTNESGILLNSGGTSVGILIAGGNWGTAIINPKANYVALGVKDDGTAYVGNNTILTSAGGTISGVSGNYTPLIVKTTSLSEVWIAFEDTIGVTHIGSARGVPSINLGGDNKTIIHSGNIGSYNAGSATKDGNGNIITSTYLPLFGGTIKGSSTSTPLFIVGNSTQVRLALGYGDSPLFAYLVYKGGFNWCVTSESYAGEKTLAFTDSNVASATKLATARTIWGQSFDGTGDVWGNLNLHSDKLIFNSDASNYFISCQGTSLATYNMYGGHSFCTLGGTQMMLINSSGNVTIGASDLASVGYKLFVDGILGIGGSGNSQWVTRFVSNSEIGLDIQLGRNANNDKLPFSIAWRNDLGTPPFTINPSGNVLIGTITDAGYKLDVNGFLKATAANFGGDAGINIGMTYFNSTLGAYDLIERRSSGATLYFQFNHNGGVNLCNGGGGVDMGGALSVKGAVTMSSTLNVSGVASFGNYMSLPNNTGIYFYDASGTIRSQFYVDPNNDTSIGYGAAVTGGNTRVYGKEVVIGTGTSRVDRLIVSDSGAIINGNLVVQGDISA